MAQLKRTALFPAYGETEGVRLIDFGGWELPVQFAAGILAEHKAVRSNAGLFDVSHMGEIFLEGDGAEDYLDRLVTGSVSAMKNGTCLYTILCNVRGGAVDDLLVYRLGEKRFMLVVNAANTEKDFIWITTENPAASKKSSHLRIENQSAQWVQIALQGPRAREYLQELVDVNLEDLAFYSFFDGVSLAGVPTLVSRTGYTGEDGFEIYCGASEGPGIWKTLLNHGADRGLIPCGLGARDTLRLEARLPLYGHELTEDAGPLEAGLRIFVDFEKGDFIGREALKEMLRKENYRVLRGVRMIDRGVPRQGYRVYKEDHPVGEVTSGGKSPSLDEFIALVRVPKGSLKTGEQVRIEINGKHKTGEVISTPFYKKAYGGKQ
ncbi:glycine cleavage system aminomethyltransferase GcvT [Marispirochaeta aestuarii]|uniref:glycine cleavage system aminomethyltransferase GcvT n=1 Tax=Marispirochaeta aestuarii TaxID=1963862 RepID=UPI0029C8D4FA|nr:glycine cleavage system aminomethyltransferase GcvT [Marispirochaeta aestuarii]